MEIYQKLDEEVRRRGWSHYKLAQYTSIPRSTVRSYLKGEREIPVTALKKLIRILGIELNDIFQDGNSAKSVETLRDATNRLERLMPVEIPVYDKFNAGEVHESPVEYIYRAREKTPLHNIEAYHIKGHSIEPLVAQNDIVVVDRDVHGKEGQTVICLINDEIIIGKLYNEGSTLWLKDNERAHRLENCEASAVVIEVIKRVL